jgi:UDP-N-acetylmuramoylalanine--D-glutamate ligase
MKNKTLEIYINELRGKSIAIVGAGVSNMPLAERLLRDGLDVTVCDKRTMQELGEAGETLKSLGAKFDLGEGYLDNLNEDVIFRTPGLHPFVPQLIAAQQRGARVTSEMEAFFEVCPCRIIAVTGSDGKTTTTTVIGELLKAEGYTVHLGGNIGHPLLTEADSMGENDFAVLELSSFQLHSMVCHPNVAVVTNVAPNHLDVHPSYEDYQQSKKSIFTRQEKGDRVVLNADNAITRAFADEAKGEVMLFSRRERTENGAYAENGVIYLAENGKTRELMKTADILIPGEHNVENYLAAFCATQGLVSDDTRIKVAKTFGGVEHRLERVRVLRGVTYINDSIASSPSRTIAGLRSFNNTKPILIVGGHDKHIPFDELGHEICARVKALVICGETAEAIKSAVVGAPEYDEKALPVAVYDDFREAVLAASGLAAEGDTVLLSPACSSFDKFKNFVERGNTFKKIVNELE